MPSEKASGKSKGLDDNSRDQIRQKERELLNKKNRIAVLLARTNEQMEELSKKKAEARSLNEEVASLKLSLITLWNFVQESTTRQTATDEELEMRKKLHDAEMLELRERLEESEKVAREAEAARNELEALKSQMEDLSKELEQVKQDAELLRQALDGVSTISFCRISSLTCSNRTNSLSTSLGSAPSSTV